MERTLEIETPDQTAELARLAGYPSIAAAFADGLTVRLTACGGFWSHDRQAAVVGMAMALEDDEHLIASVDHHGADEGTAVEGRYGDENELAAAIKEATATVIAEGWIDGFPRDFALYEIARSQPPAIAPRCIIGSEVYEAWETEDGGFVGCDDDDDRQYVAVKADEWQELVEICGGPNMGDYDVAKVLAAKYRDLTEQ